MHAPSHWKWHESTGHMTLPTSGSNDMCLAPFPRYYPTTFTVYMTACNLEKSVIFDIQLGLKDTEALRARVTFPPMNAS